MGQPLWLSHHLLQPHVFESFIYDIRLLNKSNGLHILLRQLNRPGVGCIHLLDQTDLVFPQVQFNRSGTKVFQFIAGLENGN